MALLQDSAAAWVLNLPHQSLAFVLHDAGYDVWLGNVRGSTWGLEHAHLDPSDDAFWQFTYDDMASKDIPAMYAKQTALHVNSVPEEVRCICPGLNTASQLHWVSEAFHGRFSLFPACPVEVHT